MATSNTIIWLKLRTLIFGHPLSTQNAEHAKVGVGGGVPIFGSDIISSEGYMGTVAAILVIAANTPFAGLPILLILMARDSYVPRYFKNLGDRLVYNTGIWLLLLVSLTLILIFQGDTHMMLPLYAIGVLLSFALTGIGLALHTWKTKEQRWASDFGIFSFGGVVSFLVFLVFA